MRASRHRSSARSALAGFSVVELLNFLGLAAILSAVGMFALSRYVRHAKTAEAVASVTSLASAAAEYYNTSDAKQPSGASPEAVHAMRRFPPSSRAAVPEDPLSVRGRRYQSTLADWSGSPWRELHFSVVQAQHYQYAFQSDGAGANAKATVVAEGDLDGDGRRSSYSLTVAPDEKLAAQIAGEMVKTEPEE